MAAELLMPKWGLSMQQGTIARWLKEEGEPVEQGEAVVEIETEKMTNVVESPASGVLARMLYPTGAAVPVTEVIALIAAPGEALPEVARPAAGDSAAQPAPAPPAAPTVTTAATTAAPIRAMPAARRLDRKSVV